MSADATRETLRMAKVSSTYKHSLDQWIIWLCGCCIPDGWSPILS